MKIKKFTALLSVILFVTVLFSGCNKNIEVTESNIRELAQPSIEAYFYLCGSYFYNIEKDIKGYPIAYPSDSDYYASYYKITTDITVDKLADKAKKYIKDPNGTTQYITEKDGVLYAVNPEINIIEELLDLNSIILEKQDGDIYYVSVDSYIVSEPNAEYTHTSTFKMKIIDGTLQIQENPTTETNPPVNTLNDCDFIGSYDRFLGDINERTDLTVHE